MTSTDARDASALGEVLKRSPLVSWNTLHRLRVRIEASRAEEVVWKCHRHEMYLSMFTIRVHRSRARRWQFDHGQTKTQ